MAFALIILTVHASTSEGTLMVAPPPQSVEINHARLYEQIELLSPTSIRTSLALHLSHLSSSSC